MMMFRVQRPFHTRKFPRVSSFHDAEVRALTRNLQAGINLDGGFNMFQAIRKFGNSNHYSLRGSHEEIMG